MGKETKKPTKASKEEEEKEKSTEDNKKNENEEDMPEDVRLYKEKLERETGKSYKYRAPKKDLPSISHMLAHGAPEDEGRPRTWLESIGYPLILVILFCVSFAIFFWIDPIKNSRYPRGRFALPKKRPPINTAGGSATTGSIPVKSDNPVQEEPNEL